MRVHQDQASSQLASSEPRSSTANCRPTDRIQSNTPSSPLPPCSLSFGVNPVHQELRFSVGEDRQTTTGQPRTASRKDVTRYKQDRRQTCILLGLNTPAREVISSLSNKVTPYSVNMSLFPRPTARHPRNGGVYNETKTRFQTTTRKIYSAVPYRKFRMPTE